MSLAIYGKPASRAFRVLWAAEELDLPYQNFHHDFNGLEIKSAAFRAINPNAAIPAIVDGTTALFESLAINLYLARKANKLWPATIAGEGLVFQWTLWAATEVESAISAWMYHTFGLPEPQRKPELAGEGSTKLRAKLDVLEGVLAKRSWLADDAFTIADLNLAAVLFRGPQFGLDRWPAVSDWHRRCYARPAAQRAVAMRETAAA